MSFCNFGALDTPDPHKLFQILQPFGQVCTKVIENPGIFVFSWLRKWTTDPLAVLVREMALLVINKALTLTWRPKIAFLQQTTRCYFHLTVDNWKKLFLLLVELSGVFMLHVIFADVLNSSHWNFARFTAGICQLVYTQNLSDKVEVSRIISWKIRIRIRNGYIHGTVQSNSVKIETNLQKVFLLPINVAKSLFLRFTACGKVRGSQ